MENILASAIAIAFWSMVISGIGAIRRRMKRSKEEAALPQPVLTQPVVTTTPSPPSPPVKPTPPPRRKYVGGLHR